MLDMYAQHNKISLANCKFILKLSCEFFLLFPTRFHKPINYDDDDVENSYFRRKPTSFLSDSKRHTWMTTTSDDDSVRTEGPRPTRNCIETNGGPYVVGGSYPQKSSFLSQSTDQITG